MKKTCLLFFLLPLLCLAQLQKRETEVDYWKMKMLPKSTLKFSPLDLLNIYNNSFTLKADLPIEILKPRVVIETELGYIFGAAAFVDFKEESYNGFKTGLTIKRHLFSLEGTKTYIGLQMRQRAVARKSFEEIVKQDQFVESILIKRNVQSYGVGFSCGTISRLNNKNFIELFFATGIWWHNPKPHSFNINDQLIEGDLNLFDFGIFPEEKTSRPYFRIGVNIGIANW